MLCITVEHFVEPKYTLELKTVAKCTRLDTRISEKDGNTCVEVHNSANFQMFAAGKREEETEMTSQQIPRSWQPSVS